jgi:hypothetical protein
LVVAIDYEYTNKAPAGAAMKLIQAVVCATLISTGGVAFATGKCADGSTTEARKLGGRVVR